MVEISDYLQQYLDLGWRLLPVWGVHDLMCDCGKIHHQDRGSIGKHPCAKLVPNGQRNATNVGAVIEQWWAEYPGANPAVHCAPSGLVVIDIDPRNGGKETIDRLLAEHHFPRTRTSFTGGGGAHWFYRAPEGVRMRKSLGPGVDVKHDGYVLLPPSTHLDGLYRWADEGPVAELPEELVELLRAGPVSTGSDEGDGGWNGARFDVEGLFAEGITEGERHDRIVSYAASMAARGVRRAEAEILLRAAWERAEQGRSPFSWSEAVAALEWAYSRPRSDPSAALVAYAGYIESGFGALGVGGNGGVEVAGLGVGEGLNAIAATLSDISDEGLRAEVLRLHRLETARALVGRIRAREAYVPFPDEGSFLAQAASGVALPPWTVEGLHRQGYNANLTSAQKAGKTASMVNLAGALVDRRPFLDRFDVRELAGNVGFMNYELSQVTFLSWCDRLGIAHGERLFPAHLRGRRWDLRDDLVCEETVRWLRGHEIEVWIVDPFARAYYGSENDNTEVKRTGAAKPPFFQRVEVRHNPSEVESYSHHLNGIIDEMLRTQSALDQGANHHDVAWPNPRRECGYDCDFLPVCNPLDDGSRAEDMIEQVYRVGEFLDHYGLAQDEKVRDG